MSEAFTPISAFEEALPLIRRALREDLNDLGDLTSLYFVPEAQTASATILAREPLIVAGTDAARLVFREVNPNLEIAILASDGAAVDAGEAVMHVHGPTRSLLSAERTALNFLQRLSGVATLTRRYVDQIGTDSRTRLLDTRKTTPGWRHLEKAAVAAGGGTNHRIGLFDAVMVKDNHLLAESSPEAIQRGIRRLRDNHPDIKVELEVDTLDQLEIYLGLDGVNVILLDNMPPDLLQRAVERRDALAPEVQLEASGGITLDTLPGIAATGIDFISVGALTHSAQAVDLALEIQVDAG